MKYYLNCGDEDCDCKHLILEEVEVTGDTFLLRLKCNFCGIITTYNLWEIYEDRGGEA